jgi:hypothetical protein
MAQFRKKTLTEIVPYQKGMEDGWDEQFPFIKTLEGEMYIPENGHIATDGKSRWVMTDEFFKANYELVSEPLEKEMD